MLRLLHACTIYHNYRVAGRVQTDKEMCPIVLKVVDAMAAKAWGRGSGGRSPGKGRGWPVGHRGHRGHRGLQASNCSIFECSQTARSNDFFGFVAGKEALHPAYYLLYQAEEIIIFDSYLTYLQTRRNEELAEKITYSSNGHEPP